MSHREHTAAQANRRAHGRASASAEARLIELDPNGTVGKPQICELVDLSRGGMGIRFRRMLHVGSRVVLVIPTAGAPPRVLAGEIRNVRYVGEGMHQLGASFLPVPDSAELRALVASIR